MNPNHAWAYRLKAREEAGEELPKFSREAWREVLGKYNPSIKEEKKQIKQYKPK